MDRRRPSRPTKPTVRTVRKVLALSGHTCAFPGCGSRMIDETGAMVGEVCHIRARNPGGQRFDAAQTEQDRHATENLIPLCRNHHAAVDGDASRYTVEALHAMKAAKEDDVRRRAREGDGGGHGITAPTKPTVAISHNAGGVIVHSPNAIIAGTVTLRRPSGGVRIQPPPGTLGADQDACRYVAHLISRYNEYASREPSRAAKFSYGAISKNVEHEFGSQWRLLPMERFAEVCRYLQGRILRTRIAKLNVSKGKRAFSTFDDFRRP